MEIKQQKNSNKIRFAFGEDALDYSLEDGSGSRSYSVAYTEDLKGTEAVNRH